MSIVFSADAGNFQVMTRDPTWNLAARSAATVTVDAGDAHAVFHMVAENESTLVATVRPSGIHDILDAISDGTPATIRYGTRTTRKIDMHGSTAATTAFRNCATRYEVASFSVKSAKTVTPF